MFHRNRRKTTLTVSLAFRSFLAFVFALGTLASMPALVRADEPGRGRTAQFEIDYLKFIINHHYSALRMTELAVGTDRRRNDEISPEEGTSPSPNFRRTEAQARLDEVKNLARRNNRLQREEILTAQKFLRQWYGINYEPQLSEEDRRDIEMLEQTPAGEEFDIEFLKMFSRHHFAATRRSVECLVASELKHKDLERYCRGIVQSQLNDIDEMRHLLCDKYQICDYQPLEGM